MRCTVPALPFVAALAIQPLIAAQPHDHRTWEPPRLANADHHLRVSYLEPARSWERLDLWVPTGAGPHPCVVVFYGGGYGGKVVPVDAIRELVAAGYAVALPDYALHSTSPEPLVMWDGAAAIRWLRAHAARLRIDPARMGAWGFSAGGWLVQRLATADSTALKYVTRPRDRNGDKGYAWIPVIDPHPALAEQPLRLQAVVSDWGAGKLTDSDLRPALDASDPPLLTCHNAGPGVDPPGLAAYRAAGAPAWLVSLEVGNTHVPAGTTTGVMDGQATTWYQAARSFFDRQVRAPTQATAPEPSPAGGPIAGETRILVRSVHGAASVRCTLDGSQPGPGTARLDADGTIVVKPGQTLRAISLVDRLTASPVVSASFVAGPTAPRIAAGERLLRAKAGQPCSFPFSVDAGGPVSWTVCGQVPIDRTTDPRKPRIAVDIDPATGVLAGTFAEAGAYPLIITALAPPKDPLQRDAVRDAILVVISVE
jgi:hypothetical protein